MPKKICAWTTEEILELIWRHQPPITVREYRQGWEDAIKEIHNAIILLDKKTK